MSRRPKFAYPHLAWGLLLTMLAVGTMHADVPDDEKSIPLKDPVQAIIDIDSRYRDIRIEGTYSSAHLLDSYTAGTHHVQGITRIGSNRYVLSHDTRGDRDGLLIISDGKGDTVFHTIGPDDRHPGSIQACGDIMIVPFDNTHTIFVDSSGTVLPTTIPVKDGAAGLVYDHQQKVHFALFNNGRLYKSNGKSLRNEDCEFTDLGEVIDFDGEQGGTQLVTSEAGELFAVTMLRVGGYETLRLYLITERQGLRPTSTLLRTRTLSKYDTRPEAWPGWVSGVHLDSNVIEPHEYDYGPGFRWGGAFIVASPTHVDVVAASRRLAVGPAKRYCKVKIWSTPTRRAPATANKAILYTEKGQFMQYDSENGVNPGYPVSTHANVNTTVDGDKLDVLGAVKWDNGYIYIFLEDGYYTRLEKDGSASPGYPAKVTDKNWPGLAEYAADIKAVINWGNGKVYFFYDPGIAYDGRYVRYDIKANTVDQKPVLVEDAWHGLGEYDDEISAAVNWGNGVAYFFLEDGNYVRYDMKTNETKVANTAKHWKGTGGHGEITGAFRH